MYPAPKKVKGTFFCCKLILFMLRVFDRYIKTEDILSAFNCLYVEKITAADIINVIISDTDIE